MASLLKNVTILQAKSAHTLTPTRAHAYSHTPANSPAHFLIVFLHTRQFLLQVYVVILFREVHPFISRAQQTPAGEDGYSSVRVLLAGGAMQLDEDQVTHHHCLWLQLVVESARETRARVKDIYAKYDEQYFFKA